MYEKSNIKKTPNLFKTDAICCDSFKENIEKYGWFKIEHLGEVQYLMPHILGTNIRIVYCPSCGKYCRDTVLSANLYHSK